MSHIHSIYDSDSHFSINHITRAIKNESSSKTTIIQHDHNSERFTFEMPRYIEGHDMSLCNVVQVHYLNIDSTTKAQNEDVYDVTDLQLSPEDENIVICSWLISQNATKYVGSLNFVLRFSCVTDGVIDYVWNTAVYSQISVSTGIFNSDIVAEDNSDVIASWTARIEALEQNDSGSGLTEEQAAAITANTEARHTHSNKATLDKFVTTPDGYLEHNGKAVAFQTDIPLELTTTEINSLASGSTPTGYKKFLGENGIKYFSDFIKSGTYTQEEIDEKISLIPKFSIEVVETLPTENISETTVYLVTGTEAESNIYTEYIYVNNAWECLGSQPVDIDLSNYYTIAEVDETFAKKSDIPEIPESDFSRFIEETAASVNLYPPTTEGWTDNASIKSDGSEIPNANGAYCITPPIYVLPNTTYTVKPVPWGNLADANRGRAYNESGMALVRLSWIENADGTVSFTTPENTSYVRFTVYKTNFDNSSSSLTDINIIIPIFNSTFMLVEGDTAPEEYEPYGEGKYRLKDIEIPLKSVNLENIGEKGLPIFAPLAGKKIANFGDSIFGNARPPEDVSTYLAEKTGAEVLNCAFGGCRMAIHNQLGHWNAFTMVNLAQAIASGDYTVQDEALNYDDRTSYAEEPLSVIKSTDFSTVNILTIAYGANDFTSNISLDNTENPYDTTTLAGALRTSVESLLTAYPNLRIFILSSTYRFYIDDNNEYTEDSNTRTNGNNVTISEFNAKLKEVAEEYNLPFIDNYNIGIGKFNRYQYFNANDGAHHKETGRKLIAEHLAKELY